MGMVRATPGKGRCALGHQARAARSVMAGRKQGLPGTPLLFRHGCCCCDFQKLFSLPG